ncbi:MAG TPA: peptidylprolyl isomerase [Candidatus Angelobacter sp.]|nr:peptidylprolyl isomerase [Candidatus Angelobacter sp.]
MWVLTQLVLVGGITLSLLQNSNPATGKKPDTTPTASTAKGSGDVAATVAPAQPVITVHGVCEEGKENTAPGASACAKVVTREQFESLMKALNPGQEFPANARNNLGKLYAEYLTVEAATRKAGMEDTDEFREFMNWMRVLAATEYYRRKLQEKYRTPSQEEIDAYYREHLAEYETAKLVRVLIPRENPATPGKDEFDRKARDAANAARESLVKGLDPTEVQKNAYATLGLEAPPPVDLGGRRRKDLVTDEAAEVFSLKAGEVTQIQTEPRNYVVYKVLSRETVPEDDLKKNISGQLMERKFRETMKSVVDSASVDLNERYFGPPTPDASEPPRSPHTITSH